MRKVLSGLSVNGDTVVFSDKDSQHISKIYIDNKRQVAPNEFKFALSRFGNINKTKNSDYQVGIRKMCEVD